LQLLRCKGASAARASRGSAVSSAADIARALGGGYRSSTWWRCICPIHGGCRPTLALRDGEHGLIIHCHAGCSRELILADLHRQGLRDDTATAPGSSNAWAESAAARERDRRRRILCALDLWGECHPPQDTLVATYWRSRGLAEPIPSPIRMHEMMGHRESGARRPAMVALVEHVEHGPVGVHLTYLAIDGSMQATVEPRKRSLGQICGCAVRLADADPARALVVAEGIETTASVMQATSLPGWAALSANGIRSLVLPPGVCNVLIAADNDASGAGERAARDAAKRWLGEGRRVRIATPPEPGTDFNDVLLGRPHARIAESSNVAA